MLPLTGSWATWMTQVCRTVETYLKESISLSVCSAHSVLLCVIGCRFRSSSGSAGLQLWCWDHTHREPLRRASGDYRLHGLQSRPGNQSTSSHGQSPTLKLEMRFYWFHFPLVWSNTCSYRYSCSRFSDGETMFVASLQTLTVGNETGYYWKIALDCLRSADISQTFSKYGCSTS